MQAGLNGTRGCVKVTALAMVAKSVELVRKSGVIVSEYRFVSFVPVVGERLPEGTLFKYRDPNKKNHFEAFYFDTAPQDVIDAYEFIRPADSESPAEPVPATIQATPAMNVREQFAMAAMRSLIATGNYSEEYTPSTAVELADALIAELAKAKVSE